MLVDLSVSGDWYLLAAYIENRVTTTLATRKFGTCLLSDSSQLLFKISTFHSNSGSVAHN